MTRPGVLALWFLSLAAASPGMGQTKSSANNDAPATAATVDEAALYARFERELKRALADGDPVATALLVSYPLRVNGADGSRIDIGNAAALQAHFDLAFTPSVRESIAAIQPGGAPEPLGERHIMADGTLWLDRIDHGNGPRYRVAIVNATREESAAAPYPRLAYACATVKHRIVVEQTGIEDYRYRSWNLPNFPPDAPSLQLNGTSDAEGTGECRHAIYAFERGDTRVDVSEPGCDENDWPEGRVTVRIKGKPAGDWACE